MQISQNVLSKSSEKEVRIEKTMFNSFRTIYWFSRIFGLIPFSIVCNSNREVESCKVKIFDCIWFTISICVYLLLAFLNYYLLNLDTDPHDNITTLVLSVLNATITALSFIFCALFYVLNMFNRHKFLDILKMFEHFDKEISTLIVHQQYYIMKYRRAWQYLTVSLLLAFVLMFFMHHIFGVSGHSVATFIVHLFGCFTLKAMTLTISISFITLLHNLHKRLANVNSCLRNFFLKKQLIFKGLVCTQRSDAIDMIKFIGRQYSLLTNITDKISAFYSFQIIFITAYSFTYSVLTAYISYRYIIYPSDELKKALTVYTQYWLFSTTLLLMAIYTASRVQEEGKCTLPILHDIINCYNDPDVVLSLNQLSLQIQQRCPIVNCGLFVFDWTLVFTMVAATTTYLTILLNFEPHGMGMNTT